MGNNFKVSEQQVWVDGSSVSKSSVSLHWADWQESIDLMEKFEVTGVGRPHIEIVETEEGASLNLLYMTEVGFHLAPVSIQRDWDHIVVDDFIVPIHNSELRLILEIFEENSSKLGEVVSLAALFKMLTAFNLVGLKVSVPNSFESLTKFEPRSANLSHFHGQPFPYQQTGIDWLTDYFDNSLGAMLCDEMGLGKTFQAIGLIAHVLERESTKPILLVVPASLVENWRKEFHSFLPGAELVEHRGPLRRTNAKDLAANRIIVTTYETLVRDSSLLQQIDFELVVADEAQSLKSRDSRRHQVVRALSCNSKILVTGTPIENRLQDLVALVEIVQPGLFGDPELFDELIDDTPEEARELGRLASPLILRRRVSDVASDLPELIEIDTPLQPSHQLSKAYTDFLDQKMQDGSQSFLGTLTALTQICCHPKLVIEGENDHESTKFFRLQSILGELQSHNEDKAIIFTTYIGSIDLLNAFIRKHFGQVVQTIDGRTKPEERQQIVDGFNSAEGFRVLIVNPKAGGTGLNITGANHVIHFNRQWNPAVEAQATARAYRRKQTKPVFVHKFYYLGTVEEVIHDRLSSKTELAESALEEAENSIDSETRKRILTIRPSTK